MLKMPNKCKSNQTNLLCKAGDNLNKLNAYILCGINLYVMYGLAIAINKFNALVRLDFCIWEWKRE